MAKKKKSTVEEAEGGQRQSRKDYLRQKKQEEQLRVIYTGVAVVVGLLVLILVIAAVNEFFVAPNRSVATVNGTDISLGDWQERVKYERAQRILTLENQYDLFDGDVGPIQQFSVQTILELQDAESMGEGVLNLMVEDELIAQAAEERDLMPSENEIEERVGSFFGYFDGNSPTITPQPTQTVMPTPSVTPIGFVAEEESVPEVTPTAGPTNTPLPTPTAVSAESFQQQLDEFLAELTALGVSESIYRSVTEGQLMRERVTNALAEEQDLPEEDLQASLFIVTFADEAAANEALAEMESGDFVDTWNIIRSQPPPLPPEEGSEESETPQPPTASEILWRTRDSLGASIGEEVATAAFELDLEVPSQVIEIPSTEGSTRYAIIFVTGREVRPLSAGELEGRRTELLRELIQEGQSNVEIGEFWRQRVPVVPVLDSKFLQPPTPAPDATEILPAEVIPTP